MMEIVDLRVCRDCYYRGKVFPKRGESDSFFVCLYFPTHFWGSPDSVLACENFKERG